jgi:hypothetical protein
MRMSPGEMNSIGKYKTHLRIRQQMLEMIITDEPNTSLHRIAHHKRSAS